MERIRSILSILSMIIGVALGLYVGVWVMFIGGIIQIVDAVQMTPISGLAIAFGIVKIMCAGCVGSLIGWLGFILGIFID